MAQRDWCLCGIVLTYRVLSAVPSIEMGSHIYHLSLMLCLWTKHSEIDLLNWKYVSPQGSSADGSAASSEVRDAC